MVVWEIQYQKRRNLETKAILPLKQVTFIITPIWTDLKPKIHPSMVPEQHPFAYHFQILTPYSRELGYARVAKKQGEM